MTTERAGHAADRESSAQLTLGTPSSRIGRFVLTSKILDDPHAATESRIERYRTISAMLYVKRTASPAVAPTSRDRGARSTAPFPSASTYAWSG